MNPKLLVLDDQIQYLRSFERALRSDFVVVSAATPLEAKEKLSPDVSAVLTDIHLDESNDSDRQGLEFIRWTRTRFPLLPIIAMSALDDPAMERESLNAGATKFLRKPIVVSQLKSLLQQLTPPRWLTP